MEDVQQKIKDNYTKNLKAEDYASEISVYWKENCPELFRFMIEFIHNAFNSGEFYYYF